MVEDAVGNVGRSWPKKIAICKGFLIFFSGDDGQTQKNNQIYILERSL